MADSRYFFVSPDKTEKRYLSLSTDESRHLSVVSRVKVGEIVTLLDGRGGLYTARVKRIDSHESLVEIIDSKKAEDYFRPDIAIPVIKANRMNLAVEKCVELGVRRIIPYLTERTIWRGDKQDGEKRVEKLNRKVIAACKQSGQAYFSHVEPISDFNGFLNIFTQYERVYLAHCDGKREIEKPEASERSLGIVGPEGGLTDNEINMIKNSGAFPVSLGESRLRSETAAVCLVFFMKLLYGRL